MHITFIRPNMTDSRSSDAMEPLVFAILSGLTPPHVERTLVDERLEAIPYDTPTDLVAMTVETYNARHAYQIAGEYRRRGVPVVMGGYHPTFLPDEARRFGDAVVIGDAEGLWPRVVADAETGRLRSVYRQDDYPTLDGLMPDRAIFKGKRYAPAALVQYGRGCRYACEFCSIHAFYGTNLRQRPVREVVEEIELANKKHVFLVDDNIFVDIAKAKELFHALIPLKVRWSCQVSIDVTRDRELLALMEASGCTTAVVGFESLNEANLTQMKKKWNLKHGDYATAVEKLRDHGIMIYGSFVFGYDEDTPDSFDVTLEFAQDNKFYIANFNPLTPMPGAKLYARLQREGRLVYNAWWLEPQYRYGQATFNPRRMTADQLTEGCFRVRRDFYAYSSTIQRAFDPRTNSRDLYRLGLHVASNYVARREIMNKQGQHLGSSEPLGLSEPTPNVPIEGTM
ncbi:MAG: radical SAM protein [Caldilineaceae bacterium]|nr:radical SAM protein [Caldilineaceae bacterium]